MYLTTRVSASLMHRICPAPAMMAHHAEAMHMWRDNMRPEAEQMMASRDAALESRLRAEIAAAVGNRRVIYARTYITPDGQRTDYLGEPPLPVRANLSMNVDLGDPKGPPKFSAGKVTNTHQTIGYGDDADGNVLRVYHEVVFIDAPVAEDAKAPDLRNDPDAMWQLGQMGIKLR